MMRTEVLDSIDDVDPDELDALADGPLYTWGWLKTIEDSEILGISPRYIAITDDQGLAAFGPCFLQRTMIFDNLQDELFHRWQIRALKGLRKIKIQNLQLSPALIAGIPEVFSSKILIAHRSRDQSESIAELFLDTMETQARAENVGTFGLIAVAETDGLLTRALARKGYHSCLRTASAFLDLKWKSFKEYQKSLTHNQRKSMKHADRKFTRAGFALRRIHNLAPYARCLSELAGNVYLHHANGPNPFTPRFYKDLSRNMTGRVVVNAAEREGTIMGFSLDICHGRNIHANHWGTDYSTTSKKGYVYFVLSFNSTIMAAIDQGIQSIEYGPAAWSEKARHGCRFERIRMFLKSKSRIDSAILPFLLKHVDRAKNAWIEEKVGR